MCAGIMKLSNALIYGDRLRCGSPHVEYAKLKLLNGRPTSSWLKKVNEKFVVSWITFASAVFMDKLAFCLFIQ